MKISSHSALPMPDIEAIAYSKKLSSLIQAEITESGGWISFSRYMELALYAPGLGYYSAGSQKFGESGDFVTAPEISPLFAQSLANQVRQVLALTDGDVLELGAGTGKLAAELLLELHLSESLPAQYLILEVSAHLRGVQQQTLQQCLPEDIYSRVVWLDVLPEKFSGIILGNEVLDALPVNILSNTSDGLRELGVVWNGAFEWQARDLSGPLYESASKLTLPDDYVTEICSATSGLIASLSRILQQGVILMIDYGFPHREYYHPQRNQGTLMCHYRHHAHGDPFACIGLQDITAHVDFTAVAIAGVESGTELLGFSSQAQFLINCGITDILTRYSPHDITRYAPLASQAQKLLSPAEMGDLFKVIALGKGIAEDLVGFIQGDKRHAL